MQYAPTCTDQKFDCHLNDESQTLYVSGRMQYAPTYTDQKFDSHLFVTSETWLVFRCMSLRPTTPRRVSIKNCIDARKTRRGLDKYGHFHRKPAEDLMNMAIFTRNPTGIE